MVGFAGTFGRYWQQRRFLCHHFRAKAFLVVISSFEHWRFVVTAVTLSLSLSLSLFWLHHRSNRSFTANSMDAQSISPYTPHPQLDRIHPHQTHPCHPSHSTPNFSYQSTLVVCPFPFPACPISFKTVSIVSGPIPSAYPIMYFTSEAFGHGDAKTPVRLDSYTSIDTFGGSPLAPPLSVVSKFNGPSERLFCVWILLGCRNSSCECRRTRPAKLPTQLESNDTLALFRAVALIWTCRKPMIWRASRKVLSPLSTSLSRRLHKWVASFLDGFVCATAANRSTHPIVA